MPKKTVAKAVHKAVGKAVGKAVRKSIGKKVAKSVAKKKTNTKRRGTMRSSHVHVMSPLVPALIPSLAYQGEAFPVEGVVRWDLSLGANDRCIFFVTNTGVSGTIMEQLQWDHAASGPSLVDQKRVFTIPTLALDDVSGGPTSMRAMKAGLSVTCRTPLLSRGGLVYVLNTSQRIRAAALPDVMTRAQASAFFDTIVAHPHVRVLDWADFGKPRHMYSHVVDDPTYNDFEENKGSLTINEFFQHIALGGSSIPLDRPMSTIIFACDRPTGTQNAILTAHASFYSRWPLDSIPGQHQKGIPTTQHDTHNKIHRDASDRSKLDPGFIQDVESAAYKYGKDVYDVVGDMAGALRRSRGRMGPRLPAVV